MNAIQFLTKKCPSFPKEAAEVAEAVNESATLNERQQFRVGRAIAGLGQRKFHSVSDREFSILGVAAFVNTCR
jgi:hypothetical protein